MDVMVHEKLNFNNVDQMSNLISDNNNVLVISQRWQVFWELLIKNCLDYEMNYTLKKNPKKRLSVLVVTRNKDIINNLIHLQLKTERILTYSNGHRRFLQNNSIFCDIGSPDYSFVYWSHHLTNYYESNLPIELPLHYIFPIGKGRHEYKVISRGNRNALGRIDDSLQPMFIFSDVITTAYDKSLHFDYIFIDANTIKKPVKMNSLSSSAMVFLDNYFDFRIPYIIRENNKIFAYEEYKPDEINFRYITSEFEDEIKEAFSLLKELNNEALPKFELKLINKILYNILRTSIEGVEYDFVAKFSVQSDIIRDLINELKESDYRYENPRLKRIINLIEDIYNKHSLDSYCPKYNEVISLCEKMKKNGENSLIVVASKVDCIGLKDKISQHFKLDINALVDYGFEIVTHYDAMKMNSLIYDNAIITSSVKFNDLAILQKPLGRKKTVLLYEIEIRELKTRLFNLATLENALYNQGYSTSKELIYEALYRKLKNADVNGKKLMSTIGIDDLISSIEILKVDYSIRLKRPYLGENAVKSKLITFEDGSKIFMRPGALIQYRKNTDKQIERKHVKDLKLRDEVLIIDGDAREDVYKVFIKSVSDESESAKHYDVVKKWNYIYEDKFIFMKIDLNYLYEKMVANGWNKTTKAILNNWRNGFSFGPRDKEDIVCLGKALNIKEFIDDAEFFHSSMRYIRGERRSAAKILNKVIFYSNSKIDERDSSVLEKYNLTVEEIRNVISVNKVKHISKDLYVVKTTEVGIVFTK